MKILYDREKRTWNIRNGLYVCPSNVNGDYDKRPHEFRNVLKLSHHKAGLCRACYRDSRIVSLDDIIIANLNKKQIIDPCLSTEVSSDRAAPGIAAAENEENLWSDKNKSRGQYKGARVREIKSRGTEKYKLRAPGTVLVAVLTFSSRAFRKYLNFCSHVLSLKHYELSIVHPCLILTFITRVYDEIFSNYLY